MKNPAVPLAGLMLSAVLVACTGGSQSAAAANSVAQQDPALSETSPPQTSPFGAPDKTLKVPDGDDPNPMLTNGQAVLRALDALEKKTGKPLRVTSIVTVSGVGMTLHVQEPKHHSNLDEWVVRSNGEITGPTPVHITLMDSNDRVTDADVDRLTFDPRAIPFARLNKVEHEALAKAKLTDGRLSEWSFDDQGYMISMESKRENANADVSPDLKLLRINY